MVSMAEIRDVANRIGREFRPQRILLFGSYARGTATPDSDVDLLVIMPYEGDWARKSCEIYMKVRPGFPIDLLVRTPKAVQQRLDMGDCFMAEILRQGKVLYEAPDGRMGGKGGRRLRNGPARAPRPKRPQLLRRVLSRATVR